MPKRRLSTPAVSILRKLLPLIALLGVSLAFSAPSAAARLHGLEHSANPVSAGQHHHHAADGSIETAPDQPQPDSGKDRGAKGVGHAHGTCATGECVETAAAIPPAAATAEMRLVAMVNRDLPALDPPPRERPPRTA